MGSRNEQKSSQESNDDKVGTIAQNSGDRAEFN